MHLLQAHLFSFQEILPLNFTFQLSTVYLVFSEILCYLHHNIYLSQILKTSIFTIILSFSFPLGKLLGFQPLSTSLFFQTYIS